MTEEDKMMKNIIKMSAPEFEVVKFSIEDAICTSGRLGNSFYESYRVSLNIVDKDGKPINNTFPVLGNIPQQ